MVEGAHKLLQRCILCSVTYLLIPMSAVSSLLFSDASFVGCVHVSACVCVTPAVLLPGGYETKGDQSRWRRSQMPLVCCVLSVDSCFL